MLMPNPSWARKSPTSTGFRTLPTPWKTSILAHPGIAILSPTDTLITPTDLRPNVLTTSCTGRVRIFPCVPILLSYLTTLLSRTMGKGSASISDHEGLSAEYWIERKSSGGSGSTHCAKDVSYDV